MLTTIITYNMVQLNLFGTENQFVQINAKT